MLNQLGEVFASFQKHQVKYLVIGGVAAVLYGVPRATFDLDILIDPVQAIVWRFPEPAQSGCQGQR